MKVVGIKYKTKGKCTEIRNNRERKDCSDERVLVVTNSLLTTLCIFCLKALVTSGKTRSADLQK